MPRHVTTPDGYQLLHDTQLALSEIEAAGVRIDKGYLDATIAATEARVRDMKAELRADPVYALWRRRFGEKTNLTAPAQLAQIVERDLGYKLDKRTKGGARASADKSALEGVDHPFVRLYQDLQKVGRLLSTYLGGIRREMVQHADGDWYVHPSYNLNTVITFRSSSDSPNFQNQYKRDPEYAEIMRRCYVPRRGRQFVENDYEQAEVKIAACYTEDPVAVEECTDPTKDAHRDAAARLFFLTPAEAADKPVRNVAKNGFVFPEFYGDWWLSCARSMWAATKGMKVKGSDETVHARLAANGVTTLGTGDPKDVRPGTFEAHVKQFEDWYWNTKYKVHTKWKNDWYAAYLRDGGFTMKTGLAVNGVLTKKDAVNYPIQGSAFHCLCWAMVRKLRRIRKYKMRSLLIGEIHDCDVADVPPGERDAYIDLSRSIMCDEIRAAWPWIVVPLRVEVEACPVDRSWWDKMVLKDAPHGWVPAKPDEWEKKYGPWALQSG